MHASTALSARPISAEDSQPGPTALLDRTGAAWLPSGNYERAGQPARPGVCDLSRQPQRHLRLLEELDEQFAQSRAGGASAVCLLPVRGIALSACHSGEVKGTGSLGVFRM